ncbi:MAG: polysaccharide deacetylase family protein [Elusimicrobiota bacterium]|jgi:peptidoglycan/xylan/chitin deacetylase (PgdA/CDA1 family)
MNLMVVAYHYFREEKPGKGIYPVTRGEFERQVAEIGKSRTFISQKELADRMEREDFPDRDFCLITFDDGLKEQMDAFRLLRDAGIPGVFYVPTDPLERGIVLDVHKLHLVRMSADDRDIFAFLDREAGISAHPFDPHKLDEIYRWDILLAQKVKFFLNFVLAGEKKAQVIAKLFSRYVGDEKGFSRKFYMSEEDLRELAKGGALGAHGKSHRALSLLSPEEAFEEIRYSAEYLRSVSGGKVLSFTYPHGAASTVPAGAGGMLSRAGIPFALTTVSGNNAEDDLRRRYWLKRLDTNDAPGGRSAGASPVA